MAEPDDILLQLAMRRYDEFNDDRKSINENTGLLLALSGVLVGFVANIWFTTNHSYWIWMTIVALLLSIGFCLYVCIAQKFNVIDTVKWWNELSTDPEVTTPQIFQQKIITSIDKIEKDNSTKIDKLWQYYNGAIAILLASLILLTISFF